MAPSEDWKRRAKRVGTTTAIVAGGVLLVASAAGAVLLASAVMRRLRSAPPPTEELPAPEPSARKLARHAGSLARRLGYLGLLAISAGAAWLAKLIRPEDVSPPS
ncbi:MAG: hypothetical protein JRI23_31825 [Deltaproteobacteria bacterium]|nr:hypothetical protein [Deltaproteobacteria bacterium]MBW2536813.1 hypothetical protein [Deltaproteobacteria bacterium]